MNHVTGLLSSPVDKTSMLTHSPVHKWSNAPVDKLVMVPMSKKVDMIRLLDDYGKRFAFLKSRHTDEPVLRYSDMY